MFLTFPTQTAEFRLPTDNLKRRGQKMTRTETIRQKLQQAFSPTLLEVVDDSERHRGHAGFQEGGESHFRVTLRAPNLADKGRLARHRAVHAALGPELMGQIHALELDVDG